MDDVKLCYYCGRGVTTEEHHNVQEVMGFWLNVVADTFEGITPDNSFTHMIQITPEQMDFDGNPVVCSKDLVREMSENIDLRYTG